MILAYGALMMGILGGVAGQMLLKSGASAGSLMDQMMSPHTIGGLALYGGSAFFYILALRDIPVSVAFPSVSLSYAVVALLGHFLFGEAFGWPQAVGIGLILCGVFLLARFA